MGPELIYNGGGGGGAHIEPGGTWPDSSIEPYVLPVTPGKTYAIVCGAAEACTYFDLAHPEGGFLDFNHNITIVSEGVILFAWIPFEPVTGSVKEVGVRGYRIYRNGQLLVEVPASTTSYTDSGLNAWTAQFYAMETVMLDGTVSARTDVVGGLTPHCTATGFPVQISSRAGSFGGLGQVAVDGSGNIYSATITAVTGFTGLSALVLVKISSAGALVWSQFAFLNWTTVIKLTVVDLELDAAGSNLYLCGHYYGSMRFGGFRFDNISDSRIAMNIACYMAKISTGGVWQWAQRHPDSYIPNGPPVLEQDIRLACSPNGNLAVTGWSKSRDYGGYPFLDIFNSAGTRIFQQAYSTAGDTIISAVRCSPSNDIYFAGRFSGVVDFGAGAITVSMGGFTDAFINKANSAGVAQWTRSYGQDVKSEAPQDLSLDSTGNILLAATMAGGGGNFGGSDLTGYYFGAAAVAKYNSAGTHIWSKAFESNVYGRAITVRAGDGDNVFLGGHTTGDLTFNGVDYPRTTEGGTGLVAKYTSAGAESSLYTVNDPFVNDLVTTPGFVIYHSYNQGAIVISRSAQ